MLQIKYHPVSPVPLTFDAVDDPKSAASGCLKFGD